MKKNKKHYDKYKKFDVVYADFGRNPHGVQGGIRPGIVVSCDASNHGGAPQISVVPLSSKLKDNPVHVIVEPSEIRGYALSNRSDFMPEDIQTLNKGCVRFKSGYIPGESEIREAMDRAMEGGIDDVGLGVLFGLETYLYELVGIIMHAEHLEAVHGVGPHTISVPRIKHADDIDPSAFDNSISDEIFAKICALIRISVPYTGMIISTRESQAVREKVLPLGVSQISGASRTSVGGYDKPETEDEVTSAQFDVSDQRTLDEIVNWLMNMGDIPSFCTACYRAGRTGDRFMSLCKSKQISNCCHPNALMTLMEYLQDYASPETKKVGLELIQKELENIPSEKVKRLTEEHLADIVNGQRDFRF